MEPLSFWEYAAEWRERFKSEAWEWARENIAWDILLLTLPLVVGYANWGLHPEWKVLWDTVIAYSIVFLAYVVIQIVRTPWKIDRDRRAIARAQSVELLRLSKLLIPKVKMERQLVSTPSRTQSNHRSLWVQIEIEAAGHRPVRGCRGHLMKVERWSEEVKAWRPTTISEHYDLGWSIEGPGEIEAVNLYPKVPRNLNLFQTFEFKQGFEVAVKRRTLNVEDVAFNVTDTYRFKIVISTDEEGQPVQFCIEAKWGGSWNNPLARIVDDDVSKPPSVSVHDTVRQLGAG